MKVIIECTDVNREQWFENSSRRLGLVNKQSAITAGPLMSNRKN